MYLYLSTYKFTYKFCLRKIFIYYIKFYFYILYKNFYILYISTTQRIRRNFESTLFVNLSQANYFWTKLPSSPVIPVGERTFILLLLSSPFPNLPHSDLTEFVLNKLYFNFKIHNFMMPPKVSFKTQVKGHFILFYFSD